MGCLKLTYSEETVAPNWEVWVADKEEKGEDGLYVDQNGGLVDINGKNDQVIIDQLIFAINDSRAKGEYHVDLTKYFKGFKKSANGWTGGGGKAFKGKLKLNDGGAPISGVMVDIVSSASSHDVHNYVSKLYTSWEHDKIIGRFNVWVPGANYPPFGFSISVPNTGDNYDRFGDFLYGD